MCLYSGNPYCTINAEVLEEYGEQMYVHPDTEGHKIRNSGKVSARERLGPFEFVVNILKMDMVFMWIEHCISIGCPRLCWSRTGRNARS